MPRASIRAFSIPVGLEEVDHHLGARCDSPCCRRSGAWPPASCAAGRMAVTRRRRFILPCRRSTSGTSACARAGRARPGRRRTAATPSQRFSAIFEHRHLAVSGALDRIGHAERHDFIRSAVFDTRCRGAVGAQQHAAGRRGLPGSAGACTATATRSSRRHAPVRNRRGEQQGSEQAVHRLPPCPAAAGGRNSSSSIRRVWQQPASASAP